MHQIVVTKRDLAAWLASRIQCTISVLNGAQSSDHQRCKPDGEVGLYIVTNGGAVPGAALFESPRPHTPSKWAMVAYGCGTEVASPKEHESHRVVDVENCQK